MTRPTSMRRISWGTHRGCRRNVVLRLIPLFLAAGSLLPAPRAVQAQSEQGRGPGILGGLRRALSSRPASEVWDEATRMPSAQQALPLISSLVGRSGDPVYAARASVWMGHFHYGAGRVEEALSDFEQALARGPAEPLRAEAEFWIAQCRSLLSMESLRREGPIERVHEVLREIAAQDARLRSGGVQDAWHGYLGLEGAARQAGCLGPLYYRLILISSSPAGGRARDALGEMVGRWGPQISRAPERALAEALLPGEPGVETEPAQTPSTEPLFVQSAGGEADSEGGREEEPRDAARGWDARTQAAGRTNTGRGDFDEERGAPGRADARGWQGGGEAGEAYYAVQLGAFIDAERATRELQRLLARGVPVHLDREELSGRTYYKIRMGHLPTRQEAETMARRQCRGLQWQVVRVGP